MYFLRLLAVNSMQEMQSPSVPTFNDPVIISMTCMSATSLTLPFFHCRHEHVNEQNNS